MAKKTTAPTKPSNDDLFDALAGDVTPVETKKTKSKKDKPHIDLNENEQKAFEALCAADNVYKMAEGKQKTAKSLVLPILRRKLLEKWLSSGHKTENPVVQTGKARANFVVRDVLKIELPEQEDGRPVTVKDRLLAEGFEPGEAQEIYEREFTERTEMSFRPLNDLRTGSTQEQEVVGKLMKLVLENFSTEERKLLLRKETKVEVNDGFLDRAVQHADGSIEKLDALLTVISPQWVISHMTYSGKDLKQAVADLTGGELPDMDSPVKTQEFTNGEWKAVAKGDVASLYKGDKLVVVKKCNGGADHAIMTCKKWLRDPEYRATSIAEYQSK